MAKKTPEEKLVETIIESTSNHFFNPVIVAELLRQEPLYTQDKIMELIKWIVKYQQIRFEAEWDKGNTSPGLLLADALNDVIIALENK